MRAVKKMCAWLLALGLLVTAAPPAVAAGEPAGSSPRNENSQAEVTLEDGAQWYFDNIRDGVAYLCQPGGPGKGVVKVLADTQVSQTTESGESYCLEVSNGAKVQLDLNGRTLTGQLLVAGVGAEAEIIDSAGEGGRLLSMINDAALAAREGGKATLTSGTVEGRDETSAMAAAVVERTKDNDTDGPGWGAAHSGELVVNGGKIVHSGAGCAVLTLGAKTAIHGGSVESRGGPGLAGGEADKDWYKNTWIAIDGGTVTGSVGVYHPQSGMLRVSGGEIVGTAGSGIVMRGGVVTVTGGKVKNQPGAGCAVGGLPDPVPSSPIALDKTAAGLYDNANVSVAVSGGFFTETMDEEYLGADKNSKRVEWTELDSAAEEYAQGYRYTVSPTEYWASVWPSVGQAYLEGPEGDPEAVAAAKSVTVGTTEEMQAVAEAEAKEMPGDLRDEYLAQGRKTVPGVDTLHVQTYLSISVINYNAAEKDDLHLMINPKTRVVAADTLRAEELVLDAADPGRNAVIISSTIKDTRVKRDADVTMTLPRGFVTAEDLASTKVYVYHNGRSCGETQIAEESGGYTLSFTTDGFSPFMFSKKRPVARVEGIEYATYADAVRAAESGGVLVALTDIDEEHPLTVQNKTLYIVPENGVTLDMDYITVVGGTAAQDSATGVVTILKSSGIGAAPGYVPEEPEQMGFLDVPEGKWYSDAVEWAVANDIASGITSGRFGPQRACTRADAVTFLWRAAGKPEPSSLECPFEDVKETDYCYKAVLWAVENDITAGITSQEFGAKRVCTRAHTATFLWRWASRNQISMTNPFTDVPTGSYYEAPVLWALNHGITAGITETAFAPKMPCTRAHFVTFLYRYMGR